MAGTEYIDKEAYNSQMNRLNVKYPTIDQFVTNDALIDRIKNLEIKSIKNFKEDLFVRCGNKMFKPTTFRETEDRAVFWNRPKEIQKICKDEPYSLVHFHGISYGYHSSADKDVHEDMFKSYATDGAVVGIDGIHVTTYLKHNIKIPWSKKFYKELANHGLNVIENVRGVFCTKIENNKKKENLRECVINVKNGLPSVRNIFNKVNFEEPSLETAYYPFRTLDEKSAERVSNVDYKGKNTTCVIFANNKKRYLSCFHK